MLGTPNDYTALSPAGIKRESEGRQRQGAGCCQAAGPPPPPAEAVGPAGHKVEGTACSLYLD